ncbi:uncharacterized protein [Mytilus edulis]|uniref:uncharacterized protein n=1 Tax=Mytilus edulis TaxID=6550 RepID=UPI0039EED023
MNDIIILTEKPKRIWSFLKSKGQNSVGVAPLKNKEGFLKSDSQSKANILNELFCSVFTKEDGSTIPDKGLSNINSMNDITVTENGVFKLLTYLNTNKAAGPDEIPTKILKITAAELSPILTRIFEFSLDTGEVPQY